MPAYKMFKIRHPDYCDKLWNKCRAFYAGGERLTKDERLMRDVFPPHLAEHAHVYKERCRRAFYIPYPGEIINSICSGLFSEAVVVRPESGTVGPFYEAFFKDVSPPGGRQQTLNDLLKHQVLTALLCKRAWTLIDLPSIPPEQNMPESLLEEDNLGLRNAYAVSIDPEMVLDWEEGDDGALEWVMILHKTRKRGGINDVRNICREEYTIYYPDRWERYVVSYDVAKPPGDDDEIPLDSAGDHTFGRVPLLRLELTDGMWAMGKILPIAVAHFNLRNALSWAEYKSLFPVLASFKQGMDPLNEHTHDPDRDVHQSMGQGMVAGFAEKDQLKYVGPDTSPFVTSMQDLFGLRDEMHRVLHQMALSVDNSAAALQRSADSKQIDREATAVVLRALAQVVREHLITLMETVQIGRSDDIDEWIPEGMEQFDETTVTGLLERAEIVDTISIPSPTFKRRWCYDVARRTLGNNATKDDLAEIKKELDQNINNEDFEAPMMDELAEGLETVDYSNEPAPSSGGAGKASRRMFSSKTE